MSKIPNTKEIVAFFHCRKCLAQLPEGKSPREFSELEAGFTKRGFQVWCKRHEANVIHMDFEGGKHPANTTTADIDDGGDRREERH